MAKHKIRPGWSDPVQIFNKAKAGDTVVLPEGVHRIPELQLRDLHIEGHGDPTKIIVEGSFVFHGRCVVENLTINPGAVRAIDAELIMSKVGVARIQLENSTCHFESSAVLGTAPMIVSRGAVTIVNSFMAGFQTTGAKVNIVDSSFTEVHANQGSVVNASGQLTVTGAISLQGASISAQRVKAESIEAADSDVVLEQCSPLTVTRSGKGAARLPKSVTQVLEWRAEDGNYDEVVAGKLRAGDTLRLFEGEYDIAAKGRTFKNFTIEGVGDRKKIKWNSRIVVESDATLTLKNFSIQPPKGKNGVLVKPGANLIAEQLDLLPDPDKSFPNLVGQTGSKITLDRCEAWFWSKSNYPNVFLQERCELTATKSHLAWFQAVEKSVAHLSECTAKCLQAASGAEVQSQDELKILHNDLGKRPMVVIGEARVTLKKLLNTCKQAEGYVKDAELTIAEVQGDLLLFEHGEAKVDVQGDVRRPVTTVPEEPKAPEPTPPSTSDPLAEIHGLIGLKKVKEQIDSFVKLVQYNEAIKARGGTAITKSMHSLFLGNPGTGKTTVARLFGQALYQAGAIKENKFLEVSRQDLVAEHVGGTAVKTNKVLEDARGGVLFIDEAYTLYKDSAQDFGSEAVDEILKFMEDNRDDIVIIFAGYTKEMQDFLNMNPGLASRAPNRFDFEDYSVREIADMGVASLKKQGFAFSEEIYRSVVAQKYALAADNSNGRWIRNFNEQLLSHVAVRFADDPTQDPLVILDQDLTNLVGGSTKEKQEAVDALLAELDGLIGLAPVKKFVREVVAQVAVNERLGDVDKPAYHMVFTGNPGTGKTTVARIVGKLFYNLGILDKPDVFEVGRSDLVGRYVGHTEEKTGRALDMAMGGVLFIDEAYQLNGDEFGTQAIETMLVRLENDRDKFIAIFAGYTHNMDEFLATNPGLRSRVPLTIEFPDYTPEEIGDIVVAILSKRWKFNEDVAREAAAQAYRVLPARDRANGRWARIFAENIEKQHKNYIFEHPEIGPEELRVIKDEVFRA